MLIDFFAQLTFWIFGQALLEAVANRDGPTNRKRGLIGHSANWAHYATMALLTVAGGLASFHGTEAMVWNVLLISVGMFVLTAVLQGVVFVNWPNQSAPEPPTTLWERLNWIWPTCVLMTWVSAAPHRLFDASYLVSGIAAMCAAAVFIFCVWSNRTSPALPVRLRTHRRLPWHDANK